MYDVAVIGAGPTGACAAKTLAEYGYKVLLIEKFQLPRYKSCSGVLIKKSLDLIKSYFSLEVPHFTTCTPIQNKGMVFVDDNGKEHTFEQPGLNIWRSSFDNWLTQQAVESGAELRDNTTAVSCKEQNDCVTITLRNPDQTYTENAKYIIDSEGVIGTLKKKLTNISPTFITTYQTFNMGSIDLDPHYFYAYLQPTLSEYDAWFNVKDNMLILGVSVKNSLQIPYYYEQFVSYMEQNYNLKILTQQKAERWLMPQIIPGCKIDYGVGRILFAGEIAGFLNPMGEGISAGLESGRMAALSIVENFDNLESIYKDYQQKTYPLKSYMQRQWAFVAYLSPKFEIMKL